MSANAGSGSGWFLEVTGEGGGRVDFDVETVLRLTALGRSVSRPDGGVGDVGVEADFGDPVEGIEPADELDAVDGVDGVDGVDIVDGVSNNRVHGEVGGMSLILHAPTDTPDDEVAIVAWGVEYALSRALADHVTDSEQGSK